MMKRYVIVTSESVDAMLWRYHSNVYLFHIAM